MDSLTHLVAGALTPLVFRGTPRRAAVVGFGIAAGELPDIDILFGTGPQALLTLHRGITHALAVQPLFVFLAVLPFYFWLARHPAPLPAGENPPGTPSLAGNPGGSGGALPLSRMWLMALIAGLVHIYLDSMTTFGTQIWLPFSSARVGLPAMFIIDPLLTLPAALLLALALRRPAGAPGRGAALPEQCRRFAMAGMLWVLLYPLAAYGVNAWATASYGPALTREAADRSGTDALPPLPGSNSLSLLTEPFSPFVWKAVVDQGRGYAMRMLFFGKTEQDRQWLFFAKPEPALYERLKEQQELFTAFEAFSPFMVQIERPVSEETQEESEETLYEYAFADLRYVMLPESFAYKAGRGDGHFILEARVDESGNLRAWRFLERGGEAASAPWNTVPLPH